MHAARLPHECAILLVCLVCTACQQAPQALGPEVTALLSGSACQLTLPLPPAAGMQQLHGASRRSRGSSGRCCRCRCRGLCHSGCHAHLRRSPRLGHLALHQPPTAVQLLRMQMHAPQHDTPKFNTALCQRRKCGKHAERHMHGGWVCTVGRAFISLRRSSRCFFSTSSTSTRSSRFRHFVLWPGRGGRVSTQA